MDGLVDEEDLVFQGYNEANQILMKGDRLVDLNSFNLIEQIRLIGLKPGETVYFGIKATDKKYPGGESVP